MIASYSDDGNTASHIWQYFEELFIIGAVVGVKVVANVTKNDQSVDLLLALKTF